METRKNWEERRQRGTAEGIRIGRQGVREEGEKEGTEEGRVGGREEERKEGLKVRQTDK